MLVHVSIHDVSPAWSPEVAAALELCAEAGARPALLVVPCFHHSWPLEQAPDFVARLVELQRAGHEVYLHGLWHEADAHPPGGVGRARWYLAQRVVSGGEAEFAHLPLDEVARRLDEGARVLRGLGLQPTGFVAPAWSMPPGSLSLLAERGYRYTEDHFRIYDPMGGSVRPSLVLNFASRSPVRLLSTVAYCRVMRPAGRLFPVRIAIHPGDLRSRLLRSELCALLAWAREGVVSGCGELFRG